MRELVVQYCVPTELFTFVCTIRLYLVECFEEKSCHLFILFDSARFPVVGSPDTIFYKFATSSMWCSLLYIFDSAESDTKKNGL